MIEQHPDYWDCECQDHFIHAKADRLECPVCGYAENDEDYPMPDSRVNEVDSGMYFFNNRPQ